MNREQAVKYLSFSGFSDEQIKAIEGAFSCPSAGIDCEDCPAYEPKTGHWVFDEVLDRHYYCSECKSMGVDYWDYCPNCGAKMEVEE